MRVSSLCFLGGIIMKWLNRVISAVVVLLTFNIFLTPNLGDKLADQTHNFESIVEQKVTKNFADTAVQKEDQKTDQDGIENIVVNRKLSNKYYYHFADNVPANFQRTFKRAINVYNQTGIVKLIPGRSSGKDNELTLGVYQKEQQNYSQAGLRELGIGGPRIYPTMGIEGSDMNSGQAKLNSKYPPHLSVAIHEIGHALGLDHRNDHNSIMFPIDQGRTSLSDEDRQALKEIYNN